MVDRQDIDALLISALYGELTPADEARLTTHLESHPADKSALGLLTETRATFRASGFSNLQADPPQAISAILLQEAARRAPKRVLAPRDEERAGWFARFVNSFARHPAMAAAAMIVVVAGIGGLIYSRQGADTFAEQTDDRIAASESAGSAATATPMAPTTPPAFGAATGSGAMAPLADPSIAADKVDSYRVELADSVRGSGSNFKLGGGAKPMDHAGITVTTPQAQPKDLAELDQARDEKQKAKQELAKEETKIAKVAQVQTPKKSPPPAVNAPEQTIAPGGVNGRSETTNGYYNNKNDVAAGSVGGGAGGNSNTDVQKAPAPPPPKTNTTNTNAGDAALLAWAKDQHKKVTDYVRANNCADAAKVAATIASRANDYYNTNVANDRALKACLAYINDARQKDAERTQKAQSQKKVDVNEVQPAPANIAK